jgi:hypothetical protein
MQLLGEIKLVELLKPFTIETSVKDGTTKTISCFIDYDDVLQCLAATIHLLSGHNLYIYAVEEIHFRGINLALVAQNHICLPEYPGKFIINTSGRDSAPFKHEQALSGGKTAAAKKEKGANGEDGYDGLSGRNGGNIYMHAINGHIINLNDNKNIIGIETSGGNGSKGQKGGPGQKGGAGEDIGDAKALDFGWCFFSPSFSMYFF